MRWLSQLANYAIVRKPEVSIPIPVKVPPVFKTGLQAAAIRLPKYSHQTLYTGNSRMGTIFYFYFYVVPPGFEPGIFRVKVG